MGVTTEGPLTQSSPVKFMCRPLGSSLARIRNFPVW